MSKAVKAKTPAKGTKATKASKGSTSKAKGKGKAC